MSPGQVRQRDGRDARSTRRPQWVRRAVLLWAVAVAPLLVWGLPTRETDDLLFGGDESWPAERYQLADEMDRLRSRTGGADTDLNPLADRTQLVELTADDAGRAEILRRYRLFSRQPDEMIILRALQRMDPRRGDLDPRLYQYGGAYIYAVGGAIATGAALGLVHLTSEAGFYLEHPEAFGRFYVAARTISLMFGAAALLAVFRLGRRAGGTRAGWVAALLAAACPVFITAVLEAKPHLPSAALLLWAMLAGLDYLGRGRPRDAVRMGVLAGLAAGVVLTGVLAGLLWIGLFLAMTTYSMPQRSEEDDSRKGAPIPLRFVQHEMGRDLAVAALVAVGVYILANPYFVWNLLANRAALASNLSNSTAMYHDQVTRVGEGALRVAVLLVEAAGWGIPIAGLAGLVWAWRRHGAAVAIALLPLAGYLAMAVLLGAGKPAEYARFLVLPVLMLCTAAGVVLSVLMRRRLAVGVVATLAVVVSISTPAYVRAFVRDAGGENESRRQAGRWLAERMKPDDALGVLQEPAPYAVPPLDFARRRVWLLPAIRPVGLDAAALPPWLVFTADDASVPRGAWWEVEYELAARFPADERPARIAWAHKPVFVYRKKDAGDATRGGGHRLPDATNRTPPLAGQRGRHDGNVEEGVGVGEAGRERLGLHNELVFAGRRIEADGLHVCDDEDPDIGTGVDRFWRDHDRELVGRKPRSVEVGEDGAQAIHSRQGLVDQRKAG